MAWYNYLTVEIPLLFSTFCFVLQGPIITNMYVYRSCYAILGYNESDCSQLGNEDNDITRWLEPKVQPTVNKINMVHSVTNSLLPMIFCIFVGTWSDKFGRKPFMILCFAGLILSTIINTIIIHFSNLSPWYFTMSSVPFLLTGGFSSMLIVISAYVTDVTTEKTRMIRLALFEMIFATSSVFGNLSSSYIFYATDYQTIMLISLSLLGTSLMFTIFFIPESLKTEKKAFSVDEILKLINIKEIVKNTIRKRENNARYYIFWIMFINITFGLTMGEASILTLFLRNKLHWTLTKLTQVNSISSLGNIFGTLFATLVLHKTLKFKEMPLCLFGIILQSSENILRGIAKNDYYIYTAIVLGFFNGLPHLMIRTTMSFIVAPEEIGKIFALLSIIMSLVGMISNLIYPAVYNATIDINSGTYNFVSLGIHVIAGIVVFYLSRKTLPRYTPPQENEKNKDSAEKIKKISIISVNHFEVSSINKKRSAKGIVVDMDTRRLSQTPSLF